MAIREYFILWAVGILCVFSLAIWLEKMMRIVLGNYLLTSLCLTLIPAIDAAMVWLYGQAPDVWQTIQPLLTNKTLIVLVVYLLALLLLFLKSRLSIHFHVSGIKKVLLTILGIPLTIISIATTLQVAVLWTQVFNAQSLQALVATLPLQDIYKQFIIATPVIICIHAIITILLLSNFNRIPSFSWFSFRKKSSSMPDISLEE